MQREQYNDLKTNNINRVSNKTSQSGNLNQYIAQIQQQKKTIDKLNKKLKDTQAQQDKKIKSYQDYYKAKFQKAENKIKEQYQKEHEKMQELKKQLKQSQQQLKQMYKRQQCLLKKQDQLRQQVKLIKTILSQFKVKFILLSKQNKQFKKNKKLFSMQYQQQKQTYESKLINLIKKSNIKINQFLFKRILHQIQTSEFNEKQYERQKQENILLKQEASQILEKEFQQEKDLVQKEIQIMNRIKDQHLQKLSEYTNKMEQEIKNNQHENEINKQESIKILKQIKKENQILIQQKRLMKDQYHKLYRQKRMGQCLVEDYVRILQEQKRQLQYKLYNNYHYMKQYFFKFNMNNFNKQLLQEQNSHERDQKIMSKCEFHAKQLIKLIRQKNKYIKRLIVRLSQVSNIYQKCHNYRTNLKDYLKRSSITVPERVLSIQNSPIKNLNQEQAAFQQRQQRMGYFYKEQIQMSNNNNNNNNNNNRNRQYLTSKFLQSIQNVNLNHMDMIEKEKRQQMIRMQKRKRKNNLNQKVYFMNNLQQRPIIISIKIQNSVNNQQQQMVLQQQKSLQQQYTLIQQPKQTSLKKQHFIQFSPSSQVSLKQQQWQIQTQIYKYQQNKVFIVQKFIQQYKNNKINLQKLYKILFKSQIKKCILYEMLRIMASPVIGKVIYNIVKNGVIINQNSKENNNQQNKMMKQINNDNNIIEQQIIDNIDIITGLLNVDSIYQQIV